MPEPDDSVLALTRTMHAEMTAIRTDLGEIRHDLTEIKGRLGALEAAYDSMSTRVDRMGGDLSQLARRFEVMEATQSP